MQRIGSGTAVAFASLIPAILAMLCVRQGMQGGGGGWWFLVGFLAWLCLGLLVAAWGLAAMGGDR